MATANSSSAYKKNASPKSIDTSTTKNMNNANYTAVNSNLSMSANSSSYSNGLTTSLGSGYSSNNYSTVSTNIGTIFTDTYLNSYKTNSFLRLFVLSHNEDEIKASLTKVKEICITYEDDRDIWEAIVEEVLRTKHFSEDFIINYLDEIKNCEKLKEAILEHHAGDVYSNKYPTVALRILIEK